MIWFLFVSFVILFLQSRVYHWWGLKKVGYSCSFSEEAVHAEQRIFFIERIYNRKWLPIPWMTIEMMMDANIRFPRNENLEIRQGVYLQNHKSIFSLLPFVEITRQHQVECKKRGYYELKTAYLQCGDIFGVRVEAKRVELNQQILVYPQLLELEDIPLPSNSWLGDLLVRRWIVDDPFMIAGVRDFQGGDGLNQINWKATARMSSIQVHKRDFTADHRLMIYVNVDISSELLKRMSETDALELIERGISIAASIVQHAISVGIAAGFACNGTLIDEPNRRIRFEPAYGSDQVIQLFEAMAKLRLENCGSFSALLEEEIALGTTYTDFLIITLEQEEKIQLQMDQLQNLYNAVEFLTLV